MKASGSSRENMNSKVEEALCKKPYEQSNKSSKDPNQDYIHVRAKRGQATDIICS